MKTNSVTNYHGTKNRSRSAGDQTIDYDIIKNNLDEQREPVEVIKRSFVKMESEFSVTKARMNLLKLRSTAAQSQGQHRQN